PGASYTEPALRRAIVEFVKRLELKDVTLAGESMGATVSLTAAIELEDRVRQVVAFNPYDYPKGVGRANRVASIYVGSARLPVTARPRRRDPPRRSRRLISLSVLRKGRANLGPAHSNRPEKVQHHYVEAIGGSVALPALCDKQPRLCGKSWPHETNARKQPRKSQRDVIRCRCRGQGPSAQCQFVNRAGCLGRGEVSELWPSFVSR